jgi:hypothetical protein
MPTKVPFFTEQDLRDVVLPTHGGRYAVVSHGDVIDNVKTQLSIAGFNITKELYKRTFDGQVAQGIYHLDYAGDPDMGMMFAWSNSYNKTMRFKCAVGAYVFICSNGVVSGDMGNYSRRHSGTALQDVINEISDQISKAKSHYNLLLSDKQMLKNVRLTPRDKGRILGELFANEEILTLTQVGIVKREMDNPTHNYNSHTDSAWNMYNNITFALKESHPSTFMNDHQRVHSYFVNEYGQLITASIQDTIHDTMEDEPELEPAGSDFDIDANAMGVNFL